MVGVDATVGECDGFMSHRSKSDALITEPRPRSMKRALSRKACVVSDLFAGSSSSTSADSNTNDLAADEDGGTFGVLVMTDLRL